MCRAGPGVPLRYLWSCAHQPAMLGLCSTVNSAEDIRVVHRPVRRREDDLRERSANRSLQGVRRAYARGTTRSWRPAGQRVEQERLVTGTT